jgi:hypothetical protein
MVAPTSGLVRHVITLSLYLIDLADLVAVANGVQCLRNLSVVMVALQDSWVDTLNTVRLPLLLQQVSITFPYDKTGCTLRQLPTAPINAAIEATSRLHHLHTLTIQIDCAERLCPDISFASLEHAHALTTLDIDAGSQFWNDNLTSEQLLQIRQLSQLTTLSLQPCDNAAFVKLLQCKHTPPQWKERVNSHIFIDDTIGDILPVALPHMDVIALSPLDWSDLTELHFLSRMTALRTLTFKTLGYGVHRHERLVSMLARMNTPLSMLQSVYFDDIPFDTSHLQRWLTLTPRLHTLVLSSMKLDSMAFLESVRTTLCRFELIRCQTTGVRLDAFVKQLQRLEHLTHLVVHYTFAYSVTQTSLALFALPSPSIPTLVSFDYRPL